MTRAKVLAILLAALLLLAGCGASTETETGTSGEREPSSAAGALQISDFAIDSKAVGRELEVSVIEPVAHSATKRPLLVFLHGAGGSNESFLNNEAVLSTLSRLGAKAPVIAFPDGELGWWHARASGNWERYVVREVIPEVSRRFDTNRRRVAIGGISMGGFGAYHLALNYSGRFCAVGGHSAGLWQKHSEEFPDAFDDREDWERNDVLAAVRANPDAFGDIPVWNDYGDHDWFVDGNAAFVAALRKGSTPLTAHVWPGGHDSAYWDAHFPEYLRFYATALANC